MYDVIFQGFNGISNLSFKQKYPFRRYHSFSQQIIWLLEVSQLIIWLLEVSHIMDSFDFEWGHLPTLLHCEGLSKVCVRLCIAFYQRLQLAWYRGLQQQCALPRRGIPYFPHI